jgi:hypothetical protein
MFLLLFVIFGLCIIDQVPLFCCIITLFILEITIDIVLLVVGIILIVFDEMLIMAGIFIGIGAGGLINILLLVMVCLLTRGFIKNFSKESSNILDKYDTWYV